MGWNGSGGGVPVNANVKRRSAHSKAAFPFGKWIIFTIVLIALGCIAIWMSAGDERQSPQDERMKDRTENRTPEAELADGTEEEEPIIDEDPEVRKRREMLAKMTPEERGEFLRNEVIEKPIDFNAKSNQVYNTGVEQVLSWMFTATLGDAPPPLPPISPREKAHFAEILLNRVEVQEGDSPYKADAKMCVQEAKDEMSKFIKDGGTAEEFLEYYHSQLVEANNEWRISQKQIMQVIKEEPEIAKEFISSVNARLLEKGIKPVKVAPGLLRKYGIDPEEE